MIKNYLTAVFCLMALAVLAQPKFNSPYSRYGMGDLSSRFLAVQSGRGGMTAAYSDPYHLNLANPASFSALKSAALETGLFAKNSNFNFLSSDLDSAWSKTLGSMSNSAAQLS